MNRVSGIICGCIALSVLIISLTPPAVESVNNNLHGIGHVSITTDDLESSTRFYTEILGGMVITDLSYRYHGDQHYYMMFDKEITEARILGVDPSELGVPDISNTGTYEVRGNFIVFDNGLLQLQGFARRDITQTHVPFAAHETRTSAAYVTAGHLCFLVKGDVDFNNYLVELEKVSKASGFWRVKVNPTVNVNTEAERQRLQKEQFGVTVTAGGYSGLSFGYVKGPSGEQIEFYQFRNDSRYNFGTEYCQHQAVSSEFSNTYNNNEYKARAGITGKLQGLTHIGTRSHDFLFSTTFYTDILGGVLLGPPLLGENLQGDASYVTIFHKELLDARRLGVPAESLGVPDISSSGNVRLDLRYVLFDNYPVEVLQYTSGMNLDDPPFNPRYCWSSPAYINSMSIAFQVHAVIDFDYYLQGLESRAHSENYRNVRLNQCSGSICRSPVFPVGSTLEGYRYAYMKGPSGEQIVFTQFRGHAARVLKQALLAYGALSTAFDETNPWKWNGFQQFCGQHDALRPAARAFEPGAESDSDSRSSS